MDNTIEKCISCAADTPYNIGENINNRYWYVEGAGQLCETCYERVYTKLQHT